MGEITKAHLKAKRIESERNWSPMTRDQMAAIRHEAAKKAWLKRKRKGDQVEAGAAAAGQAAVASQLGPGQMQLGSSRGDWRRSNPHAQLEKELSTSPQHPAHGNNGAVSNMGKGISESYKLYLTTGQKCNFKPDRGERGGVRHGIERGQQAEREVAAWEIAKIVGMDDMVAPAKIREADVPGGRGAHGVKFAPGHVRGVALLWQEGEVAANMPDRDMWGSEEDSRRAAMFDYIIGNQDRHGGNWVIGPGKKIKLIDHGLAFGESHLDGFNNRKILKRVAAGHRGLVGPGKYAEGFVKNKDKIKDAMAKLGLPPKAIRRVMERIDRAAVANDWTTLVADKE